MEVAEADRAAYGLQIGYNSSLAWTGVPQTFFGINAMLGGTMMDAEFFNGGYVEARTLVFAGDVGIEKRTFMGPLSLSLAFRYGALHLLNSSEDDTGEMPYRQSSFATSKRGPSAEAGLSLWLTPMFQLHLLGEKRWYADKTVWGVSLNNAKAEIDPRGPAGDLICIDRIPSLRDPAPA